MNLTFATNKKYFKMNNTIYPVGSVIVVQKGDEVEFRNIYNDRFIFSANFSEYQNAGTAYTTVGALITDILTNVFY